MVCFLVVTARAYIRFPRSVLGFPNSMGLLPFSVQAAMPCTSPAALALALAAEAGDVDETAVDQALDRLAGELTLAAQAEPGEALECLATCAQCFSVRRSVAGLDDLLLDHVVSTRSGHPTVVAVALADAAARAGLQVGLVGDGLGTYVADPRLDAELLVDPAAGATRLATEVAAPRPLTWRCGHQVVYDLLREHTDHALRIGDLAWALHTCDLRLALPLSEKVASAARDERDGLLARLN
jgi:hypothetical protein